VVVRPLTARAAGVGAGAAPIPITRVLDATAYSTRGPRLLVHVANGIFFALVPAMVLVVALWKSTPTIAFDMHHAFRPAAEAVLNGNSPYPPPSLDALATRTAWVYLPFAALLFLPFALVPPLAANVVGTIAVAAAGAAALWILGVRDWRCYGLAATSMPVASGIQTANLTLPLALALAAVWVMRDRRAAPGLVLAATLATKLFFWPLLVWLLATRRYRASAYAAAASAALIVVSWALLGFAGAREYPEILRLLASALETDSYTPFALAVDLHAPDALARAVGWALGGGVLAASCVLARRGDERRSFTLAVCAALLLTPIVWMHYFALLYVPLALSRPRLSWLWAVPVVVWLAEGHGNGSTTDTALVLATFAALVALSVGGDRFVTRRAAYA